MGIPHSTSVDFPVGGRLSSWSAIGVLPSTNFSQAGRGSASVLLPTWPPQRRAFLLLGSGERPNSTRPLLTPAYSREGEVQLLTARWTSKLSMWSSLTLCRGKSHFPLVGTNLQLTFSDTTVVGSEGCLFTSWQRWKCRLST